MPPKNQFRLLGVLLGQLCWTLGPAPVYAEKSGVPVVSGQVIRDFARITFEWPAPTYLNASADGNVLTVSFDRKAAPDLKPMLRRLRPYVSSARLINDGKAVRIALNRPYQIRSFVSGSVSGVDILRISASSVEAENKKRELKSKVIIVDADAKILKQPELPKKTVEYVEDGRVTLQPSGAAILAQLQPAAGEEQSTNGQEGGAQAQSVIKENMTDAEAAAVILGAGSGKADVSKVVITAPMEQGNEAGGVFKPTAERGETTFEAVFPWKERVAAAGFIRNKHLWVIFSKSAAMDLSSLNSRLAPRQGEVRQITTPGASVLRIPMEEFVGAELHADPGSFGWKLALLPQPHDADIPLPVKVNTDAEKAFVYIPAQETSDVVNVTDPDIGDNLIVVPLFGDSQSVEASRRFVDFAVLPTVQGVAIAKISDDAAATLTRGGVRVGTGKAARFSPNLPAALEKPASQAVSEKNATLFPYEEWAIPEGVGLREEVQRWQGRLMDASSPPEKNKARIRIAQFYLSQGLSAEAYGILQEIKRLDPSVYTANKLSALSGAALFLMYRFADAADEMKAQELNGLPEIAYWRSMISELLGNSEQVFDYLSNNEKYIQRYPPIFRQRLAVIAADRAVAAKEYNNALKIFDQLQKDGLTNEIADYINYLMGKISVETGQIEEGMQLWSALEASPQHSLVRARARFSLITMRLKTHAISKDAAIEELERLAVIWRGDSLELSVLNVLGDFYREKKDWLNAMRVWSSMNDNFRNTEMALDAVRKLNETFISLFAGAEKNDLNTFDKLVIYNRYRSLTPTDEVGDAIIERLADEMIAVDLLDQTASMLEQRLQFKYEREQRSKIGAKLAEVYLLNRQPELALKALQNSVYGNNAEGLQMERNHLAVRALIGMKDYERAARILAEDKSTEAQFLRLEMGWQRKDWSLVTHTIEELLKTRADPAAVLSAQEADRVIQLALAYVAEGESAQIKYLRDYFLPLIDGNTDRTLFEYITRENMPLDAKNFEQVMKMYGDTRQFMAALESGKM